MRSHVAGAVNGTEGEVALIGLPVASDLTLVVVGCPLAVDSPVKRFDPVLGSNGWDGTIGITRVVQHLDLALELLVDPLGGLWLRDIVPPGSRLAEIPSLDVLRNVHGGTDLVTVHVVEESGAKGARREFVGAHLLALEEPWGVVSSSDISLVLALALATFIEVREVEILMLSLRVRSSTPACAEDVVDVDFGDEIVELHVKVDALIRDTDHVRHVPVAVEGNELVVHLLAHERVPVRHVDKGSGGVVLPVGNTVSNSETLDVGLENVVILSVLLLMLDEVVGKIWDIDASIRLTRDVKLIISELRESSVPLEDG